MFSFFPSCFPSFLSSFLPSLMSSFQSSFLHVFFLSFMFSFLSVFLPSFLSSFLPSSLPSFLPSMPTSGMVILTNKPRTETSHLTPPPHGEPRKESQYLSFLCYCHPSCLFESVLSVRSRRLGDPQESLLTHGGMFLGSGSFHEGVSSSLFFFLHTSFHSFPPGSANSTQKLNNSRVAASWQRVGSAFLWMASIVCPPPPTHTHTPPPSLRAQPVAPNPGRRIEGHQTELRGDNKCVCVCVRRRMCECLQFSFSFKVCVAQGSV